MPLLKNLEEVPVEKLRWQCPPEYFSFETSDEIEPLAGIIGQKRAVEAVRIGLQVESPGYNIFVTGLAGTDRITTIQQLLEQMKKLETTPPPDICCVNNFADPDAPVILLLPAGNGVELKKNINEFIESLKKNIPQIFESEEYKNRRKVITDTFREKQKAIIKEFERKVNGENFTIVQVQMGPFNHPGILPVSFHERGGQPASAVAQQRSRAVCVCVARSHKPVRAA